MHRRMWKEYERILSEREIRGRVLEIGAVPTDNSLLNLKSLSGATEKIGLNLKEPSHYKDFQILQGNANRMDCFEDGYFDVILCNAVLEHDPYFWKTLAEIRRVTRQGGLVIIGNPGYKRYWWEKRWFRRGVRWLPLLGFLSHSTFVFRVHNSPGDYYRYSEQAFREVFFEGFQGVHVSAVMIPPRIIGYGIKS